MDLELKETFDGGDFVMKRNDVSVIEGFGNMPYIGLFGGNPGFNTPRSKPRSQQSFDFWGNNVFANNNLTLQFNSNTEHALNTTPLTSNGRILIEQAVKKDLQFMRPFARVGVSVTISGIDRVILAVRIIQPDNLEQRDFIYIWDATKKELIEKTLTGLLGFVEPPIDTGIFDFSFGPEFD